MKRALIVTDIQNDFCPGGKLPVDGGDQIIPFVNNLLNKNSYDLHIFTKDWHPPNHKSFVTQHQGKQVFDTIVLNGIQQILWPEHCIQDTFGSDFHNDLNTDVPNKYIFKKGIFPEIDSYSAFFDNNHISSTGLNEFLKEKNTLEIDVIGLALDFCVKFTALDGRKLGYNVNILLDGCKSISSDNMTHFDEMKEAGINII